MPSIIPPSPIEGSSMAIPPRPVSPTVEEAQEALSPYEDEDEEAKKLAQSRRRSSIWKKALNIRKKISKVNIPFGETVPQRFGPTEGTILSPIEVSPTTIEAHIHENQEVATSLPTMTATNMENIERSIVQNLAELNANTDFDYYRSDDDDRCQETNKRRSSVDPDAEWKQRVMAQPQSLQTRRSDASEESIMKMSSTNVEGNRQSKRPSDLPLFDDNGRPIAPPRGYSQRNQRLLSVPNIKYNRSTGGDNLRHKSRKEPISIAANLMRRLSKYQLRGIFIGKQLIIEFFFNLITSTLSVPLLLFICKLREKKRRKNCGENAMRKFFILIEHFRNT